MQFTSILASLSLSTLAAAWTLDLYGTDGRHGMPFSAFPSLPILQKNLTHRRELPRQDKQWMYQHRIHASPQREPSKIRSIHRIVRISSSPIPNLASSTDLCPCTDAP